MNRPPKVSTKRRQTTTTDQPAFIDDNKSMSEKQPKANDKTIDSGKGEERKHNTRGKRPKHVVEKKSEDEKKDPPSSKETAAAESPKAAAKTKLSINGAATLLASLDAESFQRALIQDANRLTERMLLPSSLPWATKVPPVSRNIPCDIDEHIGIITMDDGLYTPFENGSFGFGQFDTGRSLGESSSRLANSSTCLQAAARRSSDPGVMQFSTIALPQEMDTAILEPYCNSTANGDNNDDSSSQEELLLQCFNTMQARKKRKVVQARNSVRNYQISVKVGSCSSRSSILNTSNTPIRGTQDLLAQGCLEAVLPIEVQVGKKVKSLTKAKKIAKALGTYNDPRGLEPINNSSGKSSNKYMAGRTRLLWTKENGGSYTSSLSGQKIEPGAHKRPRQVLVRIILDNKPFNGRHDSDAIVPSSYSTPFQATLDVDKFMCNLIDTQPPTLHSLPQIECIPNISGDIHAICVSPGRMPRTSVTPTLNLHASRKTGGKCCTVCWHGTEGGLPVMLCKNCGLLAHRSCCLDPGRVVTSSEEDKTGWWCSLCLHQKDAASVPDTPRSRGLDQLTTDALRCAACQLPGGAMSLTKFGKRRVWMHEVCRIWTSHARAAKEAHTNENRPCALCGIVSKHRGCSAVRCAAPGCHIAVHPMCAVLSTITAASENSSTHGLSCSASNSAIGPKGQDYLLCKEYTLTFASVKGNTNAHGKDPGVPRSAAIPILLCGIHNPKRESSFYGLPPTGGYLSSPNGALTVPRCREPIAS